MDLEGIMLSKINQTPKYKHHMISLTFKVEKGQNKMNEQTKKQNKSTHKYRKKKKNWWVPNKKWVVEWESRRGD